MWAADGPMALHNSNSATQIHATNGRCDPSSRTSRSYHVTPCVAPVLAGSSIRRTTPSEKSSRDCVVANADNVALLLKFRERQDSVKQSGLALNPQFVLRLLDGA